MKKLYFILAIAMIAAITSCTSVKFGHTTSYLDYSRFSDQGFFVTEANTVPFDYTPVGSMSVTEYSGMDDSKEFRQTRENLKEGKKFDDGIYDSKTPKNKSKWHTANVNSALDAIVERARIAGGNGLMDMQITPVFNKNGTVAAITVSGMIIRH